MRKMNRIALTVCFLMLSPAMAGAPTGDAGDSVAPAELQAAMILKLVRYYNNLQDKEFRIHVMGAPGVARQLRIQLGRKFGKAKLKGVTSSSKLPKGEVDILYVGVNVEEATEFTQGNKILSITGKMELVEAGVTLGVGMENEKPKIMLNLRSSKAEGAEWNPAILRLARTIN